ncbi:MAG: NAD(P)/FAD-dependent oxidoreductase [Desulfurococcaceae archaeon]
MDIPFNYLIADFSPEVSTVRHRVVVIGAGIIGASIARVLSMFENFEVTIIDKEPDVGWGSSKGNTGIIHPGHEEDPHVHPLRASLCVRGNIIWRDWTKELSIPVKWPGELMVYTNDEEEKRSMIYLDLATMNNVPGVRLVDDERELRCIEPCLSRHVKGAIYAPSAGIISPFEAVIAIIENTVENGVKLHTETMVTRVKTINGEVIGVETNKGFIEADIVINAAGLYADIISHTAGVELDFKIRPRRGQYMLFDEKVNVKPLKILHSVPTPLTKGVYVLSTVHGNLMIGPTAEDLPQESKEDLSTTRDGLEYLYREAIKIIDNPPPRSSVIRTFSGLRAEPPGGNWLIKAYSDPWGFINVAGIRSPGLTAAPAIAEYVLKLIEETYDLKLRRKQNWNPFREDIKRVRNTDLNELDNLIARNPSYGEIVCYCKMVSKAEIIEAVNRMRKIGVKTITLDGLKFRVYVGFGRCQGAFCRWRVAHSLSQILNKPLQDIIVKKAPYGIGDIKVLLRKPSAKSEEI